METNFYRDYFKLEKDNWWFKVRRNIVFSLFEKYLKVSPEKTRILDFGCGSGFLMGELQKRGYDASGVDTSAEAIDYGTRRGIRNLKIQQGDKIDFPDGRFDLVLALDVLEHIKNDIRAIQEIERVLKPGGWVIITVPAYMFLWGIQDEVSHHFRRYTRSALVTKIKSNSNLKIIKQSYFNTLLFPPIALIRLINRLLPKPKRESDFEIGSGFINSVFYCIFNLESSLLKYFNFPFGVSILLVLEKEKNPLTGERVGVFGF